MATGDPTWQCPFCKTVYWAVIQTSCTCRGWNEQQGWSYEQSVEEPRIKTLVVNFFAGPGAGKSTMAANVFAELKWDGIECEIASEYAKDLVWEARTKTFDNQIYLFAKQYHRIFRLLGQVNVVLTDCPILLSPIYDKENRKSFEMMVIEEHLKMWTYNVFVKRIKHYKPKGRIHGEWEAKQIDRKILDLLDIYSIPFEVFDGSPMDARKITSKIKILLSHEK